MGEFLMMLTWKTYFICAACGVVAYLFYSLLEAEAKIEKMAADQIKFIAELNLVRKELHETEVELESWKPRLKDCDLRDSTNVVQVNFNPFKRDRAA